MGTHRIGWPVASCLTFVDRAALCARRTDICRTSLLKIAVRLRQRREPNRAKCSGEKSDIAAIEVTIAAAILSASSTKVVISALK